MRATIIWNLPRLMKEHGVSPLDIEREAIRLGCDMGKNTIYRIVKGDGPTRYDKDTLISVIAALRSLTGKDFSVGDLLEYQA